MSENITGKVIVITGASSGLGEAAARLLAAKGAKLVLGARRKERLDALAVELGGDVLTVACDVARRSDVQALIDATIEKFGRIDVLLNNAGLMPLSPLELRLVDDWDRMIDVNIKGVLYGIDAALPQMRKQKSGHFINVSSVAGHKVRPGSTVYSATKHAVRVISEGLRQEVKAYNIRTTIISPGLVESELSDSVTDPNVRQAVAENYRKTAIPASSFARMVAFAIEQPEDVDVNEILFRPTAQEY